jgi:hypothetical protein
MLAKKRNNNCPYLYLQVKYGNGKAKVGHSRAGVAFSEARNDINARKDLWLWAV